jgi:uncharacterized membrane-anchored protein
VRLRNRSRAARTGLVRTIRVDRRVDDLVARVRPGEIAVIDVVDLDRATAESLVAAGVSAVVNAAPSCSGRFAVHGPSTLIDAGVLLVDGVGSDVFAKVRDGDTIRLDGASVYASGEQVASGALQSSESVMERNAEAQRDLQARVGSIVADAAHRLGQDVGKIVDGDGFPPLSTRWRGRVVVVVTGGSTAEELREARGLVRRRRAIVVAVGGGADRARTARIRPDLTVVGRSGISEQALAQAQEVLILDGADVAAPVPAGIPRANAASLGSPEDTAVLLAHARGAAFVVTCGVDESLAGVLDRSGAAGSMPLLARLRGGGRHVSATGLRSLRERRGVVLPTFAVTVAALAGLSVGAVAGVGPLHSAYEQLRSDGDDEAAVVTAQVADATAFRAALVPTVIGGSLVDHSVAVLTLPGASAGTDLMAALTASGADISGPLGLGESYVDPARVRVLRDLTAQVAPPAAKTAVAALPADASPQTQLDTAVVAALVTRGAAALGKPDPARSSLLDGLAKVGALAAAPTEMRGADLVVLIVPADASAEHAARGAGLAAAFAKAARGVVVVTDDGSAASGADASAVGEGETSTGVVGALRSAGGATAAGAVSTVDTGGTQGGITTVLALKARLGGQAAGHFGRAPDSGALIPGALELR